MANRITGMYSGLDTESLIEELVKAKSKKVETLNKEKTKLEWKQEKWEALNTKIKNFYSKTVANMRWSTSFTKKATTVNDTNAVSVITGSSAMNSVQNLSIKKLASSGYLTGANVNLSDGTKATGDSLITSLKFNDDTTFSGTGSFTVTTKGSSATINISETTTISNVVSQLNAAGVTANFDEKNQRLFIGATTSGKDADFTITADNAAGTTALSVLGINAAPDETTLSEYSKVAAYSSYFTGESASDWVDAIYTEENIGTDIYNRFKTLASAGYQTKITAKQAEVTAKQAEIDELSKIEEGDEKDEAAIAAKTAELEALQAELDELNTNFNAGTFDFETLEAAAAALKAAVDYASTASSLPASYYNSGDNGAKKLTGYDAVIELNGVEFTSNTNNIEVNGLTFTCKALAENVTVTTQDDTDGIYDMVKSFLKEYNSLINEMDEAYNADATSVEPLTDEEKDAVSDSEAEKLENKVKDSLLRKDTTLGTLFTSMYNLMAQGIEVNDKTMYLSDFGINTLSYFTAADGEKHALHIDGDADDASTLGNSDKLKSMIAGDPDTVVSFFTKLGKNLYTKLNDLSDSREGYQTYGSFYQDKYLKTNISNYTTKISDAEEKLQDEEDKLYDKFAAMETALSKLDSQTSYISSLFS